MNNNLILLQEEAQAHVSAQKTTLTHEAREAAQQLEQSYAQRLREVMAEATGTNASLQRHAA